MTMERTEYTLTLSDGRRLNARFVRMTKKMVSFELTGRGDKPIVMTPKQAQTLARELKTMNWIKV